VGYRFDSALHALWQRSERGRVDRIAERALDSIDRRSFADAARAYWTPFPTNGPQKYLNLDVWLRQAAFRYVLTGLPARPPGCRTLDLGAGAGYFSLVCRSEGHDPLAVDVDDEPLYRETFDVLGLPRIVHRIEPMQALPAFGQVFDVITAFRISFDVKPDGSPWGPEEWGFLLGDLRNRLTAGGLLVLCFNVHPKTGHLYAPAVEALLTRLPGFRTRLFFEYAFLRAV
jgi:hypothetical protein